jgi:hypothetical protein
MARETVDFLIHTAGLLYTLDDPACDDEGECDPRQAMESDRVLLDLELHGALILG